MLVTPRAPGAEGRDRGEDDVRLHAAEALEIQRERAQYVGRQVGDDDIGGGHELPHDQAALGRGGIERHRALVAVHDQVEGAHAVRADRRDPAVLAAASPLDADDVGAEIGQERGAVRPGDVAPEVEDADPRENVGHIDGCYTAPESASSAGLGVQSSQETTNGRVDGKLGTGG